MKEIHVNGNKFTIKSDLVIHNTETNEDTLIVDNKNVDINKVDINKVDNKPKRKIIRIAKNKHRNWGDSINEIIFQKLTGNKPLALHYSEDLKEKHYVMCGSIMRITNKFSEIWGTGFLHKDDSIGLNDWLHKHNTCGEKPLIVHAVRGRLTHKKLEKMGIKCPSVYGDPAMIMPYLCNPKRFNKYKYGLIPHYDDYNDNKEYYDKLNERDDINLIDIRIQDGDWKHIIKEICKCEIIITSSLHGLILGDIYVGKSYLFESYMKEIANVNGSKEIQERPCTIYKYLDYASSVHRELQLINRNDFVNDKVTFKPYYYDFDYKSFIDSCPFILLRVKNKMKEFFRNYSNK